MSKAQAAKQPSIEDLLASIRQAIHNDVAPAGKAGPQDGDRSAAGRGEPAASATARAAGADAATAWPSAPSAPSAAPVEAAQSTALKRTIVTADREGLAGLLGGDVRLEEALARLSHAGRRTAGASQSAPPVQTAAPVQAAPRLRPAIDEPVARFGPQAPSHGAGGPAASPADWRHDPADNGADGARDALRPPWLRPEATTAPAESGDDDMSPDSSALWDDGSHGSRQQAFASPPAPEAPGHTIGRELLSTDAAAAASAAFNKLADAIVQRSTGGDRSLEDVTRELLRPMLKNWLDENLPSMVERLVRQEIERVARRGQ